MRTDLLYTELLACIVIVMVISIIIAVFMHLRRIEKFMETMIEQNGEQAHQLGIINSYLNEVTYYLYHINERAKTNDGKRD